ncbi:MAG: sugar transferase [Pseudomonadota bacterium]
MKRVFDICVVSIGLFFIFPLILSLVLLIRVKIGSPIFFKQQRPGLEGKPFFIYKFRTMMDVYDREGNSLPDNERMTPIGTFLRSSSLDELPELWNVLKGEMSLVGPRPLLMEYLPLYNKEQSCRHNVLPGITGWAQINGRNSLSWKKKFKLDLWYVNNQSMSLDIKILFLTIKKVLTRDDITSAEHVTAEKFKGTPS